MLNATAGRARASAKKVKTLANSRNWFSAKGYITVEVLRDILHELDDKITPGDLDLMIDEIDADGSGTVDFEGKWAQRSQCARYGKLRIQLH